MTNMNMGAGPDGMPTQPYSVPGSAPGAPGDPGKRGWSRGKRAATLLAVCAVAGGGAFAAAQAVSGSPAPAQAALTQTGIQGDSTASTTGQAAALRDALTTTNGPRRLARLRGLGGLYGQFTYETKKGPATLAFERGTITSVGGGSVVVRAANGTTWAWTLTGTSVVREHGTKESQATLAQGQAVFVGGPVTGGTRDARLIVIRPPGTTPKASSGTA